MSAKAWNEQDEAALIVKYTEENVKDVHLLAEHFNKGYRSVISKLVQLRIYEKPEIEEQDKTDTVKTMLRDLERLLDIEIEGTNLNKKENLAKLMKALRARLETTDE